jgi:hypothetical protein
MVDHAVSSGVDNKSLAFKATRAPITGVITKEYPP